MNIVMYEENFGTAEFPAGFAETLTGLSIEEQTGHFRTTTSTQLANTGWSSRSYNSRYRRLEEDPDVKAIIVKDDLIVGVMLSDDSGQMTPCLPEHRVCTYYASDNNGAGYKTRIDYTYLVCVPADFAK